MCLKNDKVTVKFNDKNHVYIFYALLHKERIKFNLHILVQLGFPHCLVPVIIFPRLSTHQQKPVTL